MASSHDLASPSWAFAFPDSGSRLVHWSGLGCQQRPGIPLFSRSLYRGGQDIWPLPARAIGTLDHHPELLSCAKLSEPGCGHCLVTLCFAGWGSGPLEPVFSPSPYPSGLRLALCLSISGPLQEPTTIPLLSKGACGPETGWLVHASGQSPPWGHPLFELCRIPRQGWTGPIVSSFLGV
jgi:hypothetical protein